MWIRVMLSLSVILVLVCSMPIVATSAPCRCVWRVFHAAATESMVSEIDIFGSLTANFNNSTLDHRNEGQQLHASSGSFRLPRWSLCDGAGFRPTSEFGLRHWASVLRDVMFMNRVPNRSVNPDEDVGYGAAVQAAIFTVVGSSQAQILLLPDTTSSSTSFESGVS